LLRKWINQHLACRNFYQVGLQPELSVANRHYKKFVVFKGKLIAAGLRKRYRSQRRLAGWCGLYRVAELTRRKQEVFIKSFRQLTDSFAYFSFNQVKEK